jgi:hypothetical protein
MLDNLRDQASFKEVEEPPDTNTPDTPKPPKPPKRSKLRMPRMPRMPRRSLDQITGMTAQQRFALAVMLLVIVCLLGTMLLLISGKMVPSFML